MFKKPSALRSKPASRFGFFFCGRAADKIRARHQPEERRGAGHHDPAADPRPCRRGDRMKRRELLLMLGCALTGSDSDLYTFGYRFKPWTGAAIGPDYKFGAP
jgi:hypothetical protein